jgi:hypothetical protein
MVVARQLRDLPGYIKERDRLEQSWLDRVDFLERDDLAERQRIMEEAWSEEEDLISRTLEDNASNPPKWGGNPYHRYYWRRQTSRL